MTALLQVEHLTKTFGDFRAVDGLSFALQSGEVVGFLGQNGAGKSTTIKMITGLVRPTSGSIRLKGEDMLTGHAAAMRRGIGAIVEAPRFYPHLSGRKNLLMVGRLYGVDAARVDALLERVGLSESVNVAFGRYSMGMKQRLGLAAVLLHAPPLIILDEPTNGLDPVGRLQIQELIAELAKEHGVTVLLCTHLLDEVSKLCSRAMVIHQGRMMLEQTLAKPEDIQKIEAAFLSIAKGA